MRTLDSFDPLTELGAKVELIPEPTEQQRRKRANDLFCASPWYDMAFLMADVRATLGADPHAALGEALGLIV